MMKQQWLALMARLDALSVRERVFLFLSVLVCLGAVLDTLWLSPAQTRYKQFNARVQKQADELQRLRDTLRLSALTAQASSAPRDELAQLAARTEQVNQAVRELLPVPGASVPLAQALEHLLRRHEGLTLVRTSALAPELPRAGVAGSTAAAPAALPPGLTRQGVSLTVAGSYGALLQYMQTLESALPWVRWGDLQLSSSQAGNELTLRLYLLGEVAP